jgi:VWFA-related protein
MTRALLIAVVAWLAGSAGRADARGQVPPVFRANVDLVRVNVLVADHGRPVTGLSAADFQLRDNGVLQDLRLATGLENVNLVVVLDTSGSVRGERIERLKVATRELLRALRPGDTASLLTFAQRIARHADAERDPTVVERALDQVTPSSRTALNDALYAGLSLVARDTERSLLILLSDGVENASWLPHDALMTSLRDSAATVYAVEPMESKSADAQIHSPGHVLLAKVAGQAGGEVLLADPTTDLAAVFVHILQSFRERYVLAYSPQGVKRGDGWHKLTVTLKQKRGRVTARPGYFAGK